MEEVIKFITNINTFILLITGVSLSATINKYLDWKKESIKKTDDRLRILEEGQLAILHNKIYTVCSYYLDKKTVSLDDLEDLKYLMEPYKKLGGNGTAEKLYCEVLELKKVKRGD